MEIENKKVRIVVAGHSLLGVGPGRPCSWGNYFTLSIDGADTRVLNMWLENLKHSLDEFLKGDDVKVRIYRDGCRAWCLIDDERIPKDYYHNKLCFTGGHVPPLEVAADAYAHVGDPDNELEQFTSPHEYWRKRGATYDERGWVHFVKPRRRDTYPAT